MSAKARYSCWHCGTPMRKRQVACKACRKKHPQAVKTQIAALTKARGGTPVQPVPMPVKPAKPRCPNPACRKKGSRGANVCARCSTPYSAAHSALADKAAADYQAQIHASPEWWRRQAMAQHDPAEREAMLAEAAKAARSSPSSAGETARLLVKASGAGTLREAWLRESDPHAREILRDVMEGAWYR